MQKQFKLINYSFQAKWKLYLLSNILLISVFAELYSQSLPADSILYNSLYEFYQEQMSAELKVFQVKEKTKWVKYLPSLGITYTIEGSPRPWINYNPLAIVKTREDSQLRKLSMEAVKLKYQNLINEKLIELENLILDFRMDKEIYLSELELTEIDDKLQLINEEKYKSNLIKPSTYLKEKKRYLEKRKQKELQKNELEKAVNQIYKTAKLSRNIISM